LLRLTTFGGVQLRRDGEPHTGAASQRRRLALLVLIASAGSRAVSRDKLLGYLWPETDGERARHALRQALHALQHALDADALFLGTNALELNPAVITADVVEFQDAAAAGAHARVAALYRGPFLDGFFVSDAAPFEQWASARRAEFARLHTASLEALAEECGVRGDRTGAIDWWRRLAAEQPVSARYALGLMRALAAAGDRTGAIQFAGVHAAVVRQELGAEPDPAVADLAARLRAGEVAAGGPRSGMPTGPVPRVNDARLAWLETALGSRYDIDTRVGSGVAASNAGHPAFDRARGVAVEIHVIGSALQLVTDVDVLREQFDRVVALDDPHVLPMYEHGVALGIVYFVVGRAPGASLRDRLARDRQLPVDESIAIARDVAAALACAEAGGVTHGDLRPRHVYLTPGGAVVGGFGVDDALRRATTRERTSATIRVGSPAYQSPEQITSDPRVDGRADIYSLGCMLYEMLAGEVPYASPNPMRMVSAKLTAPPPGLCAQRESVSAELEGVVHRCLARAPSDRYATARDLASALSEATA
jgi:DNA-binding SARP family transcriptional activator